MNIFIIRIKNAICAVWNYFKHFGWLVIICLILLGTVFYFCADFFHIILLFLVIGLFLLFPMKFIYALVSGRNSLRSLFLLFIITQILFSVVYYFQIDKFSSSIKTENRYTCCDSPNREVSERINCIANKPEDVAQTNISGQSSIDFSQILLNTFYIALIQECSPFFEGFVENNEDHEDLHDKFFVTLNIQIFISWLYLGVLIASLFNKISKTD